MSKSQSAETTVVLIHGWPGLPSDYDRVRDHLAPARVIAPSLEGFGDAFRGSLALAEATAEAYARRLLDELDRSGTGRRVVIAGYDIGSRIAQAALRLDPSRFVGAVLTPAYPGIGDRATAPHFAPVFWYQHFHRETIAISLLDGRSDAIASYIDYIWTSWSGPVAEPTHPGRTEVIAKYSRPGAFTASTQWYRANQGYSANQAPITTPVVMLWPTDDPLFPLQWADRLSEHFTHVKLLPVEGSGHFVPIEAPSTFVAAIRAHLAPGD